MLPAVVEDGLPCWTEERKQLHVLLLGRHSDLAELYARAVNSLLGEELTRPSLMVGSHCLRELFSCLLEVQGIAKPERSNTERASRELSAAWIDAGLGLERPVSPDADPIALRPVPGQVFEAARVVAVAGAEGTQNARIVTALVATGQDIEINTPSLRRLHKAIRKFTAWAHRADYTAPLKTLPPASVVEAELNLIEQALLTRFANRADRVRGIRELLNSTKQTGKAS